MNTVEALKYGFSIRGNDGRSVYVTSKNPGLIEVTQDYYEGSKDTEAYFDTLKDAIDYIVLLLDLK